VTLHPAVGERETIVFGRTAIRNRDVQASCRGIAGVLRAGIVVMAIDWNIEAVTGLRVTGVNGARIVVIAGLRNMNAAKSGITCINGTEIVIETLNAYVVAITGVFLTNVIRAGVVVVARWLPVAQPRFRIDVADDTAAVVVALWYVVASRGGVACIFGSLYAIVAVNEWEGALGGFFVADVLCASIVVVALILVLAPFCRVTRVLRTWVIVIATDQ